MFRILANRILDLLFPETCPSCNGPSQAHRTAPFCNTCWAGIQPYEGPMCRVCGLPLPSSYADRCAECTADPPEYETHRSFSLYDGTLREAIHRLKYGKLRRLAPPLADLLFAMDIPDVDYIVPVPLHPSRLKQREFNQAGLVARHLSRRTGIPLDLLSLEKVTNTPPQVGLPRRQRLANERKAFRVLEGGPLKGRRVLLMDDVATTGATLRACARALAAGGTALVEAVTLARSTPDVWSGRKTIPEGVA